MANLPQLPENQAHSYGRWSDNIHAAYDQISSICLHASNLLSQEADPNRLQIHLGRVVGEAVPLLVALEGSDDAEDLPVDWFRECAKHIAELSNSLASAQQIARTM